MLMLNLSIDKEALEVLRKENLSLKDELQKLKIYNQSLKKSAKALLDELEKIGFKSNF